MLNITRGRISKLKISLSGAKKENSQILWFFRRSGANHTAWFSLIYQTAQLQPLGFQMSNSTKKFQTMARTTECWLLQSSSWTILTLCSVPEWAEWSLLSSHKTLNLKRGEWLHFTIKETSYSSGITDINLTRMEQGQTCKKLDQDLLWNCTNCNLEL